MLLPYCSIVVSYEQVHQKMRPNGRIFFALNVSRLVPHHFSLSCFDSTFFRCDCKQLRPAFHWLTLIFRRLHTNPEPRSVFKCENRLISLLHHRTGKVFPDRNENLLQKTFFVNLVRFFRLFLFQDIFILFSFFASAIIRLCQ